MAKTDLYFERIAFALVLGSFAGFGIAYKLESDYIVWITICNAVAFGIETITRVSKETKEANPPQKLVLPPKGVADPLPPKPKKIAKKFYKR